MKPLLQVAQRASAQESREAISYQFAILSTLILLALPLRATEWPTTAPVAGAILAFVPAGTAPATGAVALNFKLQRSGNLSLGIYDGEGRLVRTLFSLDPRKAGAQHDTWDGRDDQGQPVEPGVYRYHWLVGKVLPNYLATFGNGLQPYDDAEHSRWPMRGHGLYCLAADEQGAVYMGNLGGEGQIHLQKADRRGRVLWGATNNQGSPRALALDGKYLYVLSLSLAQGTVPFHYFVERYDRGTGEKAAFPLPDRVLRVGGDLAQPTDPCGLAVSGDRMLVTLPRENAVATYDLISGKEVSRFPVDYPTGLGLYGETLYVLDPAEVLQFSRSGEPRGAVRLEGPASDGDLPLVSSPNSPIPSGRTLYVDSAGNLFVAYPRAGQIIKYDLTGKRLTTWGRGGSFAGKVEPDKLIIPTGVAVDAQGNVFTAEALGSRVQKWNAAGRSQWALCTVYAEDVVADPDDPTTFWTTSDGIRKYRVNHRTGAWTWEGFWPNYNNGGPYGEAFRWTFMANGAHFVRYQGHKYLILSDGSRVMFFELVKDEPVYRAVLLSISPKPELRDPNPPGGDQWDKNWQRVVMYWADENGDQRRQLSEMHYLKPGTILNDASGNLYIYDNLWLRESWMPPHNQTPGTLERFGLTGVNACGAPLYDFDHPSLKLQGPNNVGAPLSASTDAQGNVYALLQKRLANSGGMTFWATLTLDARLRAYRPDGAVAWTAGHKARGFKKPGEFYYGTHTPPAVVGGYVFVPDVSGPTDLIRASDGLWVAMILSDGARGASPAADVYCPNAGEFWTSDAFQWQGRTYFVAQDHGIGIFRLYEIRGLDQIKSGEGTVNLTQRAEPLPPAPVATAPETGDVFIRQATRPYQIDGNLGDWQLFGGTVLQTGEADAPRAEIWARYTPEDLYLAVRAINDPTPGINDHAGPGSTTPWDGDAVELFFGAGNDLNPDRRAFTDRDVQLILPINPQLAKQVYVQNRQEWMPGSELGVRVDPAGHSWTVEARIPWAYFGSFRPQPGVRYPWDMRVNFSNADRQAGLRLLWHSGGQAWVDPSGWGRCVLVPMQ